MSTENLNPSSTPETDTMFSAWNMRKGNGDIEGPGDFCRRKERECNRLKIALQAAIDLLDDTGDGNVNKKLARWKTARESVILSNERGEA